MTSPYAAPLSALEADAHVAVEQQVTERSEARLQHLPWGTAAWLAGGMGAADGGAGCADGDC